MSPLWPNFAIAQAAWDAAVDQGLVDPPSDQADNRRAANDTYQPVRRPIRRYRASSYAL
jgi:hypothetical protein